MRKTQLLIAALCTLFLTAGCSANGSVPTSTPTTAPEPAPSATAEPEPPEPQVSNDLRNATDNPLVNATIHQLLEQDIDALLSSVQFNQQPCTTADGLGGPPKCGQGIEDGTLVTFLPILGPGEGAHLTPDEIERVFDYQNPQLIRVILVDQPENIDEAFPAGAYAVILEIGSEGLGRTFRLNEQGKIIRVDYAAWPAAQEAENIDGEILFSQ